MNDYKARCITLCALFSKEVINTVTGERLGYITDADLEIESGTIKCFYASCTCRNPFSKRRETRRFSYNDIAKIGDDIILIKSCYPVNKNTKK